MRLRLMQSGREEMGMAAAGRIGRIAGIAQGTMLLRMLLWMLRIGGKLQWKWHLHERGRRDVALQRTVSCRSSSRRHFTLPNAQREIDCRCDASRRV